MNKKIVSLIIATLLLAVTATSAAEMVRDGTKACGGTYSTRQSGEELHNSSYSLRNHNDDRTITIERVVAWKPDGTIAFDSDIDILPATFHTTLLPHQGTKLKASDLLAAPFTSSDNLIQVHFQYSLDARGSSLSASVSHVVTVNGYQVARHHGSCRSL